jgi:UDP-N-acetylglucosamine 2-epimerase (non-hydrolysing)
MRVATVCGTRPELIKLAPLVPLLQERFPHHYLFTGQHFSPSMVQVFVDELRCAPPDCMLPVHSSDYAALTAATREGLAAFQPDVVLVYGDTNSTVAGARAARDLGAILIHIEAGIRSFDRSMPEEGNRVEVDGLADLRLAPTGLGTWFLSALEGLDPRRSPAVGNLVVDAWVHHRHLIVDRPLPAALSGTQGAYAVLTLHRQATVDDPVVLGRALRELGALPFPVFFPVHPRTQGRMREFGLPWPSNVITTEPMGYFDFGRAMSGAAVLLTDSGGVQEEAITLDIPCVTLRPNTERMETVFLGANRLFDLARHEGLRRVVEDAMSSHADRPYKVNPYGTGFAAARTAATIELLAGRPVTASFPDEPGMATLQDLDVAAGLVRRRPERHA